MQKSIGGNKQHVQSLHTATDAQKNIGGVDAMSMIRSDRHIYRELAKLTQCKRTRMMYFRNMARVWHKEKATAGTVTR